MSRGLIGRDAFLTLEPAAQKQILLQSLLLFLTALELTRREPDDWEAAAFLAALTCIASDMPVKAYREVERMLQPAGERKPLSRARHAPQTRDGLRRRLLAANDFTRTAAMPPRRPSAAAAGTGEGPAE